MALPHASPDNEPPSDPQRAADRVASGGPADDPALLSEIVSRVPALVYQTGGKPDGSSIEVPFINARARELLGIEPEAIRANPMLLLEAIHPDDRPAYYEKALESMAARSPFSIELRVVSPAGEVRWLHVCSRPRLLANGDFRYDGVAVDITRQKAREEALLEAKEQLGHYSHERLRDLMAGNLRLEQEVAERRRAEAALQEERRALGKLLDMQDRERRLVSFEIHDGLLQDVVAAQMRVESLLAGSAGKDGPLLDALRFVQRRLTQAVDEGRRLVAELRPVIFEEMNVVGAIHCLVNDEAQRSDVAIRFARSCDELQLSPLAEGMLFRIAQEALNNVRRHSQARSAEVRLLQCDGQIVLEVADDGQGFEPGEVGENRFGLEGIRARARLFGGTADIVSRRGQGTLVRVSLPQGAVVVAAAVEPPSTGGKVVQPPPPG